MFLSIFHEEYYFLRLYNFKHFRGIKIKMTVIDLQRVLNRRKLYVAEKSFGGKTTNHRKICEKYQ